ncbi:hypothetical protein BDV18DRAFT_6267 [Aspergillus unguis]
MNCLGCQHRRRATDSFRAYFDSSLKKRTKTVNSFTFFFFHCRPRPTPIPYRALHAMHQIRPNATPIIIIF